MVDFPFDLKEFVETFVRQEGFETKRLQFHPILPDGSHRLFWRVREPTSEHSLIAMSNPPRDSASRRENYAYVMIGRHLFSKGLPVPEIYRFDLAQGWILMEDKGSVRLQDLVLSSSEPSVLYERILEELLRLQTLGVEGFDPSWCSQTQNYDRTVMRRYESDYFRNSFLVGYLGMDPKEIDLESSFAHLAEAASLFPVLLFLHRDFQSRNIMVSNDSLGILDWQGGRLGPPAYDLASLLVDPYTDLSSALSERLYRLYLDFLRSYNDKWVGPFEKTYPYLAIQRNLQILGAFSHLVGVKGKDHFKPYIGPALGTLHGLLDRVNDPKLSSLLRLVRHLRTRRLPL